MKCLFHVHSAQHKESNKSGHVNTMKKAIDGNDKIGHIGGATASALALQMLIRVVVPQAHKDSRRVMIFITDGMLNIGRSMEGDLNVGRFSTINLKPFVEIDSAQPAQDNEVINFDYFHTQRSELKRLIDKVASVLYTEKILIPCKAP